MDARNYNITNKIYAILNNVKGFDVAMSNPKAGKMLVRHEGISFYLTVEPIFNDNEEGRKADNKPFEEIARNHRWIFN